MRLAIAIILAAFSLNAHAAVPKIYNNSATTNQIPQINAGSIENSNIFSSRKFTFLENIYDSARVSAPTGDTRGIIVNTYNSSLVGGRFNLGFTTGVGTYSSMMDIQYGILWGWNALALGTTNSGAADNVKGSVNIGYNNYVGKTYGAVFGADNALLATASFAAGSQNIVGMNASSPTNAPILTNSMGTNIIVLAGNRTNEFSVGRLILISQDDNITPELQLRTVVATAYDTVNSTLTLNTNLDSVYNTGPLGWVMTVTNSSGSTGGSAALGTKNRVFGRNSLAVGGSNYVLQTGYVLGNKNWSVAEESYIIGSYNTNGLSNRAWILGNSNTFGAFNSMTAIGANHSLGQASSTAIGDNAKTLSYGEFSRANGSLAVAGDAQVREVVQRASTQFLTTNWFNLYNDGTTTITALQNSGDLSLYARIVGKNNAATQHFDFEIKALIKRSGGSATLIWSNVTTNYSDVDTIWPQIDVSAGSAFTIQVKDQSASGTTYKWVADVRGVDLVN